MYDVDVSNLKSCKESSGYIEACKYERFGSPDKYPLGKSYYQAHVGWMNNVFVLSTERVVQVVYIDVRLKKQSI